MQSQSSQEIPNQDQLDHLFQINPKLLIQEVIQSDVLQLNLSPTIKNIIITAIANPLYLNMLDSFIRMLVIKQIYSKNQSLQNENDYLHYQTKLLEDYSQFVIIPNYNKEPVLNSLIFTLGYTANYALFKQFKTKRALFTQRQTYDTFHILLYVVYGIFVSDHYLKGQFERIFTKKFMFYEREQKENLISKKKKENQNEFLGKKLLLPKINTQSGDDFFKNIHFKFSMKKKQNFQSHNQIITEQNFDDSIDQDKANEETKAISRRMANLYLNVNQVSKSMGKLLNISQIQQSASRFVKHNQEKLNDNSKMIELITSLKTQQSEDREMKKSFKQPPLSIYEIFNLKNPSKEELHKHPQLDHLFKNFLEMNYILNNHQEHAPEIIEIQNLRTKMNQQPQLSSNDFQKQLIRQYVKKQINQQNSNNEPNQKFEPTEFLITESPNPKRHKKSQEFFPSSQQHFESLNDLEAMNIQSDRNYEDKRKEYKKKYFNLIYQQSTDSKIDTLIQKLKQKKNLIKHK